VEYIGDRLPVNPTAHQVPRFDGWARFVWWWLVRASGGRFKPRD